MGGLVLGPTGNSQGTIIGDIITMPNPNGLTVGMDGKMIDIEAISEARVVEEEVVVVGTVEGDDKN
jgi:hypothetical protein